MLVIPSFAGEHTNVIHKTFNQFLVAMFRAIQGLAALVDKNSRGEFDFELVLFFDTRGILVMISSENKTRKRVDLPPVLGLAG